MTLRTAAAILGLGLRLFAASADDRDPTDGFFAAPVHRVEVTLDPEAWESLRRDPRAYVAGVVTVDGREYPGVGVRIKGSAGSRRSIDDRPALTLDVNRFSPGQSVSGLRKLHLNNSVQDRSRMNEWLGSFVFLEAGIPTARVTHARMFLNRQDLGVYVVKEGYDRAFVRRHFRDPSGNLYDGGFLRDIDQALDRDAGSGPEDRVDLGRLLAACDVEDPVARLEALARVLDLDRFRTFAALEIMLEHWDGYCLHANNYRLYHEPATGRFTFIPHGMDQLFGRASMPVEPGFRGQVAQALFSIAGERERLLQRMETLMAGPFSASSLGGRLDHGWSRLEPVLKDRPRQEAWAIEEEIAYLREGVQARIGNLRDQLAARPRPFRIDLGGRAPLTGWRARGLGPDGPPDRVPGSSGLELHLRAGPGAGAPAWWVRTVLAPGRYRAAGRVRTREIGSPDALTAGAGAGLRLRAPGLAVSSGLTGSVEGAEIAVEFGIDEERPVELVIDLHATAGEAWIDAGSLVLENRALPADEAAGR